MTKRNPFEEDKIYLRGRENWLIRMYYYLENGLNILNEFRNLFLGLFGLYIILKLDSYIWLIVMAVPAMIILTFVGHYNVHKLSKMKEWLGTRFSTHYGLLNFNYNEQQTHLLEEIRDLLKQLNK